MLNYRQMKARQVLRAMTTSPQSIPQLSKKTELSEAEVSDAISYLLSIQEIYTVEYKQSYHYIINEEI